MKTRPNRPQTQAAAIEKKWLSHYNALLRHRERLANERRNELRDATEALEPRLEKTGAVRAPRLGSLPAAIRLLLVALAAFAGCATAPIPGASPGLLEFLQPGSTSRQEAIVRLGQPSAAFEGESILTYRVGEDNKQGRYIVTPKALLQWQEVRYSLVLIFDGNGVLQKKSLVDVR